MLKNRRPLSIALGLSMLLHAFLCFLPFISSWVADDASDNQNDVLSWHKGGKVPKVHIHLNAKARERTLASSTLHIYRLPDNWQPQPAVVHHRHPSRPTVAVVHKISKPKNRISTLQKQEPPVTTHNTKTETAKPIPTPVVATDSPKTDFVQKVHSNPNQLLTTTPAPPLTPVPPPTISSVAPTLAPISTPAQVQNPPPTATSIEKTTTQQVPSAADQLILPANLDSSAFPQNLQALYHIRVGLAIPIGVDVLETWHITNDNYQLQLDAHKFGFHAQILSMGTISDKGLRPTTFQVFLNHKLKIESQFSYPTHLLTQGHPNQLKTTPFREGAQDMFSFAYELALIFSGHDQMDMTVTNGTNLYSLQFKVVGEELLQLPLGKINTLHLQGNRQILGSSSSFQSGYDAWLAPGLSNFPVKMSGPDSSGKLFVLILKALEFEGHPIFGTIKTSDNHDETAPIPDELKALNN